MSKATSIIAIAQRLIGITEKKGNAGFSNITFERDMKIIGWYVGAPWCAFAVRFIMLEAYCNNEELTKEVKRNFTGGALDTLARCKKSSKFSTGFTPKIGSVVVWQNGNGTSGHIGIVESFDIKNNTMVCLEGNTNANGSREGNQYARKLRTISRSRKADGLNLVGFIYPFEI